MLEIFPDNTVKVEYVDFGNQTEVSTSQLRPVTEDYTRLPLLAFRCMLHGTTGGFFYFARAFSVITIFISFLSIRLAQ